MCQFKSGVHFVTITCFKYIIFYYIINGFRLFKKFKLLNLKTVFIIEVLRLSKPVPQNNTLEVNSFITYK